MLFLEVLKKDKGKGITSSTYISNQYNRPAKIFMLSKNKRLISRVEESKKEKEIGQKAIPYNDCIAYESTSFRNSGFVNVTCNVKKVIN